MFEKDDIFIDRTKLLVKFKNKIINFYIEHLSEPYLMVIFIPNKFKYESPNEDIDIDDNNRRKILKEIENCLANRKVDYKFEDVI